MTEPSTTTDNCPSCGRPASQPGDCDDFSHMADQEPIPVSAKLLMTQTMQEILINCRWIRIGRDETNQVVLRDDLYASRYHAWVTYEQDQFWVEDLGSTNGTLLNGEPLDRREVLASGDKIKVGETELLFQLL